MAIKLGSLYLLISGKSEGLKQELAKAESLVKSGATKMASIMSDTTKRMFSVPGLLIQGGLIYGLQRATKDCIWQKICNGP